MVWLPWNSNTKSWNLGLKYDHQIWYWQWPWLWISKVKFGLCYISAKNGVIAKKWKANISIELKSSMTIKFDLGYDLESWGLTHHGPVPHICIAIFSAYFPSAPDMWRWFQCSFPQCPIYGALQTAHSSPVPQIVIARPHLLSPQRPIYVARHGPLSLHMLCGKYWMLSPKYWLFFPITVFHKF